MKTEKFAEVIERSRTGEKIEEKDFDMKLFRLTDGLVKKYDIRFDPERPIPKDAEMADRCFSAATELYTELGIDPAAALVVGDGRSEIKAGTDMGSVTLSRLPADAARQRELHIGFGVNYIVEDYTNPGLKELITEEKK